MAAVILLSLPGRALADGEEPAAAVAEAPSVSPEQGFYTQELDVTITAPAGYTVYYTTDCSTPSMGAPTSMLYKDPIRAVAGQDDFHQPTAFVIRCMAVAPDGTKSAVVTKTYFVGEAFTDRYDIPVFSLVTDDYNLNSAKKGIFANPKERGKEWERPISVSYFVDSQPVLSMNAGVRVHGAASRGFRIKSMRLYARAEYDEQTKFAYPFFEDGPIGAYDEKGEPIDGFKRILLRNGGNEGSDGSNTMIRDMFGHYLASDDNLDGVATRPVIVFLNGTVYGLFELQEREDEHHIKEHYDIKSENLAVYDFGYDREGNQIPTVEVEEGLDADAELQHYLEAYEFCTTANLADNKNFEIAESYFDIDNFIEYYCLETFISNGDWPGNNVKAWRYIGAPNEKLGQDGRYRWFLYDLEYAWGLYGRNSDFDTIAVLMNKDATGQPAPKGATALFRAFYANAGFRQRFASAVMAHLNTDYSGIAMTTAMDALGETVRKTLEVLQRYHVMNGSFRSGLSAIKAYAEKRSEFFFTVLEKHFSFGGYRTIRFEYDAEAVTLYVNGKIVDRKSGVYEDGAFVMRYAKQYPLEVALVPTDPHYEVTSVESEFDLSGTAFKVPGDLKDSTTIKVLTERIPDPTPTPIPTPTPTEQEPSASNGGRAGKVILFLMIGILVLSTVAICAINIYRRNRAGR